LAAEKRNQENGLNRSVALSSNQSGPPLPGDLYSQCVEQWVKLATGDNKHEAAGLRHRIAEMVREMEAEGAGTKSERLLIEQVAIQWVQVHFYELLQASTPEVSAEVAEYKSRKAELALRKYIKAIESLAKIRTIPIRARTLVMQQTVLPSEAPKPCIDVASAPVAVPLLPVEPCLLHGDASVERTCIEGPERMPLPGLSSFSSAGDYRDAGFKSIASGQTRSRPDRTRRGACEKNRK
jgi:hypothetical protein